MKTHEEIRALERLRVIEVGYDGGCGEVYFPAQREPLLVIWSSGEGWEHVSVSLKKRCPTWDEMCRIKNMFWNDEETVVQYHPPKSEYVNTHPYCLHLWRKKGEDFERPPKGLVG